MLPKLAERMASIWVRIITFMNNAVERAALIIFPLILTYVPQTHCVAFTSLLDQMFHFAGFTSNSVSTQRLGSVRRFNCGNVNRENEKIKQKGSRIKNWTALFIVRVCLFGLWIRLFRFSLGIVFVGYLLAPCLLPVCRDHLPDHLMCPTWCWSHCLLVCCPLLYIVQSVCHAWSFVSSPIKLASWNFVCFALSFNSTLPFWITFACGLLCLSKQYLFIYQGIHR